MSRFDSRELVARLGRMEYSQMIAFAEEEAASVQQSSSRVAGALQARAEGSAQYLKFIGGLLYFLRHAQRPMGLSERDFMMIRPLIESLVARGQFKPEALKLFADAA